MTIGEAAAVNVLLDHLFQPSWANRGSAQHEHDCEVEVWTASRRLARSAFKTLEAGWTELAVEDASWAVFVPQSEAEPPKAEPPKPSRQPSVQGLKDLLP